MADLLFGSMSDQGRNVRHAREALCRGIVNTSFTSWEMSWPETAECTTPDMHESNSVSIMYRSTLRVPNHLMEKNALGGAPRQSPLAMPTIDGVNRT